MASTDHNENSMDAMRRELRAKLNRETSPLTWPELQRHFARGVVIVVEKNLDLIEVAATFAEDSQTQIAAWLAQSQLRRALDTDAQRWHRTSVEVWAVVVAPWVLVQEVSSG